MEIPEPPKWATGRVSPKKRRIQTAILVNYLNSNSGKYLTPRTANSLSEPEKHPLHQWCKPGWEITYCWRVPVFQLLRSAHDSTEQPPPRCSDQPALHGFTTSAKEREKQKENKNLPLTKRSSTNVLSSNPNIASIKHECAKCQGLPITTTVCLYLVLEGENCVPPQ